MPALSLEEKLKSTLEGLNRGFFEADEDLHRQVFAANEAIDKITNRKVTLKLERHIEEDNGVGYHFRIQSGDMSSSVGYFYVSTRGYPIFYARNDHAFRNKAAVTSLNDRTALSDLFSDLATNPDSPLIQSVAFFMRRKP